MAAGGRRPGAGRPRGVTAGTKHARLEKMLGKGSKTPLEYMLNILNDKKTSPEKKYQTKTINQMAKQNRVRMHLRARQMWGVRPIIFTAESCRGLCYVSEPSSLNMLSSPQAASFFSAS